MDEDQSLVLDVETYDQAIPLPQSLPENVRMPLSLPPMPSSSLPPMPSTLPPSPPKSFMTSYQNNHSGLIQSQKAPTSEPGNLKIQKNIKKKKRLKYCLNVPFFFRPFMNPSYNSHTYVTAAGQDYAVEGDESSATYPHRYDDSSSWVEEDYGVTYTNNLYRNPNRGLGNSSQGTV